LHSLSFLTCFDLFCQPILISEKNVEKQHTDRIKDHTDQKAVGIAAKHAQNIKEAYGRCHRQEADIKQNVRDPVGGGQ